MKLNIKKELTRACTPPKPVGRDSFLAGLTYPKLTYPEFILSQVCYIRKRVWLASAAVLLAAVGTVGVLPESGMAVVWVISAVVPFWAVLTAAEISRSNIFGMSEIEAGCRFALPQLTGARMMILGICNFAVIAAVTAVLGIFSPFGTAKSALYILTPYVLVNGISLAVFDRVRGQDGVYLSAAAALAVSMAGVIFSGRGILGERTEGIIMTALCAAGMTMVTVQAKKILMGKDNYYGTQN